ncbi:MAG: hypothetical protein JWM80_5449 [Cyanobacteria bacterium RYN_339]|nr:hypothetical protein [Cyanobacteria bacterium RYN_339]
MGLEATLEKTRFGATVHRRFAYFLTPDLYQSDQLAQLMLGSQAERT